METLVNLRYPESIAELDVLINDKSKTTYVIENVLNRDNKILVFNNHSEDVVSIVLSEIDSRDSGYVFFASELNLDPLNNCMVPTHRLATPHELSDLQTKRIPTNKLPILRMLDPIRRWHNFPVDSVIAIDRPDVSDEQLKYNSNYVYYWNHVGLELNRLTHSLDGPHTGPPVSSRVLGILHLAIHDAYFSIEKSYKTYLGSALPNSPNSADPKMAVAGAAITVLEKFYARRNISSEYSVETADQLDQFLKKSVKNFPCLDALSKSYMFGIEVGGAMFAALIKPGEPGASKGSYRPKNGRYGFDDDPTHPVKLVAVDPNNPDGPKRAERIYHAPFYGMTAKRFAVQKDHVIADPPVGFGTHDVQEYNDAIKDVIRMGGAPMLNSTLRRPYQTADAHFWAYDGSNLIGTPPRMYNLILRQIAWDNQSSCSPTSANTEFVRLFALVNVALTDAGILCWREKYCFEFWRPLSGIRKEGIPLGDPFWLTLGAPETNTDRISFKPPFPSYPSGHATFGGAAFQIMRRYYKKRDNKKFENDEPDNIKFTFVSDELNGVSRDLRQPYDPNKPITEQLGTVRTLVPHDFESLWEAIFNNAISRVWLGVHWGFDAFAAKDVLALEGPQELDGTTAYKKSANIKYITQGKRKGYPGMFPIGGVPLGINIADDIFDSELKPAFSSVQHTGRDKC